MFKIPIQFMNMTAFPDHCWRFGKPKAFYISIDDKNAIEDKYFISTDSSDDDCSSIETNSS